MDVSLRNASGVVKASVPIALSYSSTILYESIDLLYLSSYSNEAFAALFPSFVVWFNVLMIFVGAVKYVRILMSGEIGRGTPEHVGQLLWLGFLVALIAAVPFTLMSIFSSEIFSAIGHAEEIRRLEEEYFEVMCYAAFFQVCRVAFESVYMAAAKQRTVLVVEGASILVHICLAPLLIFGVGFFPELGIQGCAYATLVASVFGFVVYCVISSRDPELARFKLFAPLRFDATRFRRLVREGTPAGVERALEELTWTVLLLIVGQFGVFALALSNVAINVLELAFFPMLALGEVLSVEVARRVAAGHSHEIRPLMRSVLQWVLLYAGIWIVALTLLSGGITALYFSDLDVTHIKDVDRLYTTYFAILCLSILFGSLYFIYNSALAGFHDTSFPMAAMLASSVVVFAVPTYVALLVQRVDFLWGWTFFLINFGVLSWINRARYRSVHSRLLLSAS